MSRPLSRPFFAFVIISALVLTACSTSDTSGIRTRNSALVDTCIDVTPTNNAPLIVADINTTCATAIVDINEFMYAEGGRTTKTPLDDRLNPTAQQLYFDHNFNEYTRGFEARDNNTPVEYLQVSGIGGEPASMTIKRSIIAEVQPSDSCFIPDTDGFGVMMFNCTSMDNILVTHAPTGSYTYHLFKNKVTFGSSQSVGFSPSTFYFSVLAMKNGFPQQRMTIRLTEVQTFEYRFYSYSEPTTEFPFRNQVEEVTTTTVSPDTTVLVNEVTTTVASTSTSTPDNTAETSTSTSPDTSAETTTSTSPDTTDVPTPSTTGPINITALSQQFSDDCSELNGIEVFPAVSDWTDSTRFEFTISNECMTRPTYNEVDTRYVWHEMVATNTDTDETMDFPRQGDPKTRVSFNGRLTAGEWTIDITQFAGIALQDGATAIAARSFTVNVASDPNSEWKWCTREDISFTPSEIVADCDYTSATLYLAFTIDSSQEINLNPRGVATDVSVNASGWIPGGISFNADGYYTDVNLLLCLTNCQEFPSELDAEVLRTTEGVMITPQRSSCDSPLEPIVGMFYLTQVNANFIVHSPLVADSRIDGALTNGVTSIFPSSTSSTHVLLMRDSLLQRSECTTVQFPGVQWSVIAIPTAVVTPSGDIEPVAASLPARLENLEIVRQDTTGAPIIVDQNQTVLEIPVSAVSSIINSPSVASVSVQTTDGTWKPVSSALSTFVAIDSSVTDLKVKYTFADGTESVVTKPLIGADVYQEALDAGSPSSSSPLMFIAIMLAVLVIAGSGFTYVRRRKA